MLIPLPHSAERFTSKERDAESGLDYFGARYFSSAQGRFTSPDPLGGALANPQSLNLYVYALNNPLKFVDPTGMVVEWNDSEHRCQKGEEVCRSSAQRAYENKLQEMRESKNKKTRENGNSLSESYARLQESKAVFEVTNDRSTGSNGGEITYQGNDHFTISLRGNDNVGLTDNQRLAHEFEHGRQVLDGELSFHNYVPGKWLPFAHDLTDEAKGFQAGFEMEPVSPGQGAISNSIQQALNSGGIAAVVNRLAAGTTYQNLPKGPINVVQAPPAVYRPPQ